MSIDPEFLILQALQTAAIAAVDALPEAQRVKVKPIGRTFEIPNNGRYLELIHSPNNIEGEFWGSEKTFRGLFRLMLHWGMDDAGTYEPIQLIGAISAYFEKGKTFQNGPVSVKVYEQPNLTGVIEAPPELIFPCSVRYSFFQA